MSLIRTVTFSDFCDAWRDSGRESSFTHNGKRALFDWLEERSECCEIPQELDIIALDCAFCEYADLEELQGDYEDIGSLDALRDKTTVLEFNGGLIIAGF